MRPQRQAHSFYLLRPGFGETPETGPLLLFVNVGRNLNRNRRLKTGHSLILLSFEKTGF
jgi:hypothetical protein